MALQSQQDYNCIPYTMENVNISDHIVSSSEIDLEYDVDRPWSAKNHTENKNHTNVHKYKMKKALPCNEATDLES